MNLLKDINTIPYEGKIKIITHKAGTKQVLRETEWIKNMVMNGSNTGLNMLLQRLGGDSTWTGNILYGELGTGVIAVATTDTQLTTPVARVLKSTSSISGSTLSIQFFIPDANLSNGTYNEFGSFVDGSITLSTGSIFNHVLISPTYTKATGEDTTIQLDITLSQP